MKILFMFTLTINAWLLCVMIIKSVLLCFNVPWSVILTLFSVSLIVSIVVHMQSWKCWKYLRHSRQRLHSFHEEESTHIQVPPILMGWLWLMSGTAVGTTYMCIPDYWIWSFFSFIPAVIYTAGLAKVSSCTCSDSSSSSASSSSSESSDASNVNTLELDTGSVFVEDSRSSGDSQRGAVN